VASRPPGFFAFQALNVSRRCISRSNALYDGAGASHDVVEQDLYDPNVAADYFCAGGHGYYESDELALRLQLDVRIGGGLIAPESGTRLDPAPA
jgi:hypothetical protein